MNVRNKVKMTRTSRALVFASLVIFTIFVTLWTKAAYDLAGWGWRQAGSLGNATFLPFPTGPRGVLLFVLVKMSPADEFIYLYLLKTGLLVAVCVLLWTFVVVYGFKVFLPLLKKPSPMESASKQ